MKRYRILKHKNYERYRTQKRFFFFWRTDLYDKLVGIDYYEVESYSSLEEALLIIKAYELPKLKKEPDWITINEY